MKKSYHEARLNHSSRNYYSVPLRAGREAHVEIVAAAVNKRRVPESSAMHIITRGYASSSAFQFIMAQRKRRPAKSRRLFIFIGPAKCASSFMPLCFGPWYCSSSIRGGEAIARGHLQGLFGDSLAPCVAPAAESGQRQSSRSLLVKIGGSISARKFLMIFKPSYIAGMK